MVNNLRMCVDSVCPILFPEYLSENKRNDQVKSVMDEMPEYFAKNFHGNSESFSALVEYENWWNQDGIRLLFILKAEALDLLPLNEAHDSETLYSRETNGDESISFPRQ